MGRSSVRSLKTARTNPFLPGPDRPKTDPKRPKDCGLFPVFFLGENWPKWAEILGKIRQIVKKSWIFLKNYAHLLSKSISMHFPTLFSSNRFRIFWFNPTLVGSNTNYWFLKWHKKTEKKPEDRCKKDRPARRPKGSGPRPPEDRKL